MHPLVPLSLLESMRDIDVPIEDASDDLGREIAVRRLGANRTVADQIDRYRTMVMKGTPVDVQEAVSIIRLCGRRPDAGLVFSDAGRRAAERALDGLSLSTRIGMHTLPRGLRHRVGWGAARRIARNVFAINLERQDDKARARFADVPYGTLATPDGTACSFFGSAIAALLRGVVEYDGAVTHDTCVGQNDPLCEWYTQLAT